MVRSPRPKYSDSPREIIKFMAVAMGICCGECGRVYLVSHPDNARRIRYDDSDPVGPSYKLTCECSFVRFFDSRELLPYSISACCVQRGCAHRGEYLQIARLGSASRERVA